MFCSLVAHRWSMLIFFVVRILICWAPSISHFPISDDEKNKMLPEAESINKDGSQDGLMEAANIPLQSKEEDQMWKILKTDER